MYKLEELIDIVKEAIKFQEYAFGQLQKVLLILLEEERVRCKRLLVAVMKNDSEEH